MVNYIIEYGYCASKIFSLTLGITRLRVGKANSIYDNLAGKTRLKIAVIASRVNAVVGRVLL